MSEPKEIKIKPLYWIRSSKKDLLDFPNEVKRNIGHALNAAQHGSKSIAAKPLKGFSGSGVLEIVEDFDSNTYRAIYTVRMKNAIYALHIFQKKSKKGIATPKKEIDLVKRRLKEAEEHYKEWEIKQKEENNDRKK